MHLGSNKKDPTLAVILTNNKLCIPITMFLILHFQNIIPQSSTFHKFRRWQIQTQNKPCKTYITKSLLGYIYFKMKWVITKITG